MTMPKPDPESRPKNREVENEMVKVPPREGEPPRPATEPAKTSGKEQS
jgi:hypothetical protein